MGEFPVVSILCTAFNEELHLDETLSSIRAQTYPHWEMLLIDDASTDETVGVMRRHASKDPRFKIVSAGVKLGKVEAFNCAFDASTGDWIVLMGADDLMPPDSLEGRLRAVESVPEGVPTVGYFKLLTMSDDRRFDGILLPRGESGSRSGPSLTMNRDLARRVFPVPASLPSEDTWLGEATAALAERVIHSRHVVVKYRIHAHNSNPRHKSFDAMDIAMFKRAAAYDQLLAHADHLRLPTDSRHRLEQVARAQQWRHEGRTVRILLQSGLPIIDRLALASMSNRVLWAARKRFYSFFSGRRGR